MVLHVFRLALACQCAILPKAALVAFPAGVVSAVIEYFEEARHRSSLIVEDWDVKSAGFTAFSGLLAFLLVFRSSQAYGRYWNGCRLAIELMGSFFDATSASISFTFSSKAEHSKIIEFRQTIISLTSLLTAVSFNDIAGLDPHSEAQDRLKVIGWQNFDEATKSAVQAADEKVHLVFFWWQCYASAAAHGDILNVPPPILARVFAKMGAGFHNYQLAKQLNRTPFPFHYTHVTVWLLLIHLFFTPLTATRWASRPSVAFLFAFMLVFVFWALYLISVELEHPFGESEADVDVTAYQRQSNQALQILLTPEALRVASFSEGRKGGAGEMEPSGGSQIFHRWRALAKDGESSSDDGPKGALLESC
mmetsp:Transcript_15477/g.31438  ORF Transcript_15477/g.31438 Transcript_15477/m.31438 type:complete len:364 (-) Transcript_15477:100-1191(-)